jgi:hypothetical protein
MNVCGAYHELTTVLDYALGLMTKSRVPNPESRIPTV